MPGEEMMGMFPSPINPCIDPPELLCHPDNPETIDPDSEEPIAVTRGVLPMSWEIAGTGFSLANPGATERTNTVIATSEACGAVTVTVTDACNQPVQCIMRCTVGQWIIKETANINACVLPGTAPPVSCGTNCWSFELIIGNKKQVQAVAVKGGCGYQDPETCCNCAICCAPEEIGCNFWECLPCIDWFDAHRLVPWYDVHPNGDPYSVKSLNTILAYSEWEC